MYFLLKMGIFQPAMLIYQRVGYISLLHIGSMYGIFTRTYILFLSNGKCNNVGKYTIQGSYGLVL